MWHFRLGHAPFAKVKRIPSLPSLAAQQPFVCNICPMARQSRLHFPQKTTSTSKFFEQLNVDLWGPYHISTHENYKYFVTIVDDYSRSTWTHLISNKSNTLQVLKSFVSLVENQFSTTIKTIRTDNGLEFVNAETHNCLQSKGIIHQTTCPYTPQQNGVVETARALLYQSKLPLKYWGSVS